ncbi:hypothetical protein [Falsiroseomonas oryzae]|uniref:hypothetical protein n=1 Tax=Falsiroseomonas oryzae TaxID=2766473 RepID=UPI0022EA4E2C|nr:hypothetical protein [Roseomonas sp. MO-31]
MNGFALHGLDHLSATSLNLWAAQPALWVVEKLLRRRASPGCAAHRGTAVQHGVSLGLFDPELGVVDCRAAALAEYDRLTALSADPNRAKEREAVPGLVETALAELRQYGPPTPPPEGQRQHRVEAALPDVPVPVVGYQDFVWDAHGIVLDLKTQLRLAGEISPAHARQGAVYVAGTNRQMRFCYATPKKVAVYALEDPRTPLLTLRHVALRLERFLHLSRDPQELVGLLCPDFESFWWSAPEARALGRDVYGF